MGRMIVEAIDGASDMTLAGLYAPGHAGEEVAGHSVTDDAESLSGADVIVESTRPDVVVFNLQKWADMGAHVVVGTSGVDEQVIAGFWPSSSGCLIVPNFSVGAVLMMRFAELAAPHFEAVEVVELHHDEKADAPSGTAAATARRISSANARQNRRVDSVESVPGVRGGTVENIPVHSIRLPGLLAHQEVIFGGEGEVLTIRHDSMSRESFSVGVLAAVRHVPSVTGVVTGLDAALGI
jgi:4-hydroxy-tetrahydrodipicolinate reductase